MLEQNLISYLILELAKIGADSKIRVSIGKMFFFPFRKSTVFQSDLRLKKCSFYTIPFKWEYYISQSTHANDKVEHPRE